MHTVTSFIDAPRDMWGGTKACFIHWQSHPVSRVLSAIYLSEDSSSPPPWAAFCNFHITERARGGLVCIVYVFGWITSINILNQFCRAGSLSWVWHKPGRVWKGKQKVLSLGLSAWPPVHGMVTWLFSPLWNEEWSSLEVWNACSPSAHKEGLKTLSQERKNARLTAAPMFPNWMALRNSTSLTPTVIFRTQWMLNSSLPIIRDLNVVLMETDFSVLTCLQRPRLPKL